jgi:hypothetical protein
MRYGIIGSRTFNDYSLLYSTLEKHFISKIISGGAKGADTLGSQYATEKNIPLEIFYPDWVKYPRTGGFIRNKLIVRNSDILIAFWDNCSRGTKNSLDYAEKLKKKIIIVNF